MSDTNSNPAEVERELERTRSRLGTHLDELQNRLSPGQMLDDLMEYLRGTEGAEFSRNLIASARANPMPLAVTAVGLSWLMATNKRGADVRATEANGSEQRGVLRPLGRGVYGAEDRVATTTRLSEAEKGVERRPGEAEHAYSERLEAARGQALGLARHAQESAQSFSERVKHAVASLQETASDAYDSVTGSASSAASSAQSAAHSAADYASRAGRSAGDFGANLVDTITESPVVLGVLGLAAGALLGSLIPHSEAEEQALGGAAASAREAVHSTIDEAKRRGSQAAETAIEKGKEAADQHGLRDRSPGELVDSALSGDLARDAKDVARQSVTSGAEAARSSDRRPT